MFQCYFQDLFASSRPTRIDECLQSLAPIVTKEINGKLLQDCAIPKVKVAVF